MSHLTEREPLAPLHTHLVGLPSVLRDVLPVAGKLPTRSGQQRTKPISRPTGEADQCTLSALSNSPCGAVGLSTPTRPTSQDLPVGAAPLSPVTRLTSPKLTSETCKLSPVTRPMNPSWPAHPTPARADGAAHKITEHEPPKPLHPRLVGLPTLLRDALPVTGKGGSAKRITTR